MLFFNHDPSHIPNPDPNYHYLWAPMNPTVLADYLYSGYEFVVNEKEIKELFGEQIASIMRTSDGRVRRGDTVLLKCPRERWEEIQKMLQEEADDQKRASEASFFNAIDSIGHRGIKPFMMSGEEYADRRAFETRESNNRVGYTPTASKTETNSKKEVSNG